MPVFLPSPVGFFDKMLLKWQGVSLVHGICDAQHSTCNVTVLKNICSHEWYNEVLSCEQQFADEEYSMRMYVHVWVSPWLEQ